MNIILRVISLTFSDSNDAISKTRKPQPSLVVIVANAVLWIASWTIVLAATMHAAHHGPLALSLVAFVGVACVVAERHFPCVATRITLVACVLTLYQRSRAALASPYAETAILAVYGLLMLFEWAITAHGVYALRAREREPENSNDNLRGSNGIGDMDLPDFRGDPELGRLFQILSEGVYLTVAALPSTDYSLASIGHSPLRLSVGLLMLVFSACNTLCQTLSGSHMSMADHAFRNAMMVTHAPYAWLIPLARALGDIALSIMASRLAKARADV